MARKGVADLVVNFKVKAGEAQAKSLKTLEKGAEKLRSSFGAMAGSGAAAGAVVAGSVAAAAGVMLLTVGAASKFETAFAGIRKTVEASEKQFGKLQLQVRALATEIPISTSQLASIGELGGQLGVSVKGLDSFIETIGKLGVATRMSTESGALGLARMMEIFQLSEDQVENLASSLVDLGNNFAALEDEIMNTSLRLAAGGKVAGATAADVLGIATALQAVGVQSQAGGTAFARIFQQMSIAAQGGTRQLDAFSRVMQLSTAEVRDLIKTDPSDALILFVQGLQRISDEGGNVVSVLEELDLKQQRTIRALLATAEAGDLLADAITRANISYKVNTALNEEAEKRFETLNSQVKILRNNMTEFRIELGQQFLPVMKGLVSGLSSVVKWVTPAATSTDEFGKTTAKMSGVLLLLSTSVMLVVKNMSGLIAANVKAAAAGKTTTVVMQAQAVVAGKSTVATQRFAKALIFLRANWLAVSAGFVAILGVLGAISGQMQRAREAGEKYIETTALIIPLQKDILDLENKISKAREGSGNSALLSIYERQYEELKKVEAQLDIVNKKAFIEASGRKEPTEERLEESTKQFDKFLKDQAQLARDGEEMHFMTNYADFLGVSMDTAILIAEEGTSEVIKTFAKFNEDQMKTLAADAGWSGKMASNAFVDAMMAFGKNDIEGIQGGLSSLAEEFNNLDEEIRGSETSTERMINSGAEMDRVFRILYDSTQDVEEETETFTERVAELIDKMNEASDATVNLTRDYEAMGALSSFSIDEMIAVQDKNIDRMIALNELVLLLTNEGFPALGKAALLEGPATGIQLASHWLSMTNEQREAQLDQEIRSNAELADYRDLGSEVTKEMVDQLHLQQDGFSLRERENAMLRTQKEIQVSRAKEELAVLKEIFNMQQARVAAEEAIAKARQDLRDLTQDLVYDGITITQNQIQQLELTEAISDFKEAIFKYGEEGVVTASEELAILRKQAQLDKVRDKISMKMTARERKSIRDKEKEVKFLELAVEQGVAEQLDLDAAKEELDELKNPMTAVEKEMLELEEKILDFELQVLEARKESVSPEVIDAMKGVLKVKDEIAKRDDEIAKAQDAIGVAISSANILYAEQKTRIDELTAKYGPLDDLIYRVGMGIGIPGQILANTVSSMQTSYDMAKDIINKIITMQGGTGGPSVYDQPINWWKRGKGNSSGWQYVNSMTGAVGPYSSGRSPGITNMFGNPDLNRAYGGKVPMGRTSTVGELGPERIMSLPGGGTMVFPNKTGGGRGISVANLNVNITGLPADPITARKVALNIRKELVKLDKEGSGGTGLRNR